MNECLAARNRAKKTERFQFVQFIYDVMSIYVLITFNEFALRSLFIILNYIAHTLMHIMNLGILKKKR